jgi:hypothetical protein
MKKEQEEKATMKEEHGRMKMRMQVTFSLARRFSCDRTNMSAAASASVQEK